MQLSEKIDSLIKRKIDLTKKVRKCKSTYVRVLTRSKIASTLIELIHFKNVLKNISTDSNKQLKVHIGCKGILSKSALKRLHKKYTKKIVKKSNSQSNFGIPGAHLTEIPSSFITNEPKLKNYTEILNSFKKLKVKALLYSYTIDSNNEIWFGNPFFVTKNHKLRNVDRVEQRALNKGINSIKITGVKVPDLIDANTLNAI